MARGLYHQTGVGRNDMVIHQDHRGRWRLDLVTSTGGTHQTLGTTRGFGSPEEAFGYALDEQHVKGLRGKSHVWIQQGDSYVSYEPEGAHLPFEPNRAWSRAEIDDLPDEAFLYVDRACIRYRDDMGRSHPFTCRHFPYRDQSGDVDLNHLRNALSRIPQSNVSEDAKRRATAKAQRLLEAEGGYAPNGDLYADLEAAGCQLDHHESDLYVLDTPEARAILREHRVESTPFTSELDRRRWLDVPFHYTPFWESKQQQSNGRKRKLPSERDTPEMESDVQRAFYEPPHQGKPVFEHGHWWVVCNCGAQWSVVDSSNGFDFEQVSDGDEDYHQGDYEIAGDEYENNGPRTGILSDGTRVNVYLDESTPLDAWTVVPHSLEWDSMARGEMREMLGISMHGSGSQWTEGQEGRHLGRKVAWVEVPDAVKRHIERRLVAEKMGPGGMVANARGTTVDEHAKRELELYIENEYALIGDPQSIGKAIDANLRKKMAKGKYDPALAPKAWQYLIDEGAKRYAKAYSSSERDATQIFNAATRRAVAAEFARAWETENLKP